MKKIYVFCCIALIVFLSLALAKTVPAEAEIPSSGPVVPSPGQPISRTTATGGEVTQVQVLTLNQCIEIALRNNPTIRASLFGVDVNQSRVGEARSTYYPQLSASAAYTRVGP